MAAPTVGAVMADILPYLGVERVFPETDPQSRTVVMGDFTGMTPKEAEKALKAETLTCVFSGTGAYVTGQIPAPGQSLPGGSQVLLYLGEEAVPGTVQVPDFMGMTRSQALETEIKNITGRHAELEKRYQDRLRSDAASQEKLQNEKLQIEKNLNASVSELRKCRDELEKVRKEYEAADKMFKESRARLIELTAKV
jgi:hypothetical protein